MCIFPSGHIAEGSRGYCYLFVKVGIQISYWAVERLVEQGNQAGEQRRNSAGPSHDSFRAVQFYGCAVDSGLRKAEAHDERGYLLVHQRDLPGAESELEAAIKDEPSLSSAHFHLGTAFQLQQRYPEAVAELKKAVALDPSNSKARYDLDLACRHLNQPGKTSPKSIQP